MVFKVMFILMIVAPAFAGSFPKVGLHEVTTQALNSVLENASLLHDAFFNQDDQEIESDLRRLVHSIQVARHKTQSEKGNSFHINRILDTAHFHFQSIVKMVGDDRKKSLRLGYEQIVLLAQTYKLNPYRIYYCGKGDTIWLQKANRAQNPFSPQTMADCGVLVR